MNYSTYRNRPNQYAIAFKIFYSDGTFVLGKGSLKELKKTWDKAPNDYVQFVMIYENQSDGVGRQTRFNFQGSDFYFFDGEVFGATNDSRLCVGAIKNGKWLPDEDFVRIRDMAMKDHNIKGSSSL